MDRRHGWVLDVRLDAYGVTMRVLLMLACIPLLAQTRGVLAPLTGNTASLEIVGEGHVSRAQIAVAAGRGMLLHDQAAAALLRAVAKAPQSRLARIGKRALPLCPTAAIFVQGRIKSKSTQNSVLSGVTLALGAACLLWGDYDTVVQATAPSASSDVAHLLPDAGVDLPWSGIVVLARALDEPMLFEVK